MKKLEYKLQFNTPAFMLVSDSTKAQWRTPPIKTMLRFWWRILRAESLGYNTDLLRQEEARLLAASAVNRAGLLKSESGCCLSILSEKKLPGWVREKHLSKAE